MPQTIHIPHQAGASPLNAVPYVFVDECKSDLARVVVPSTNARTCIWSSDSAATYLVDSTFMRWIHGTWFTAPPEMQA